MSREDPSVLHDRCSPSHCVRALLRPIIGISFNWACFYCLNEEASATTNGDKKEEDRKKEAIELVKKGHMMDMR